MKDQRHRNYNFVEQASRREKDTDDLKDEIKFFIQHAKLSHDDYILLKKLLNSLEQANQSSKVLRGLEKRFNAIRQQYQR
jgi:hypothetical protein